MHAKDVSFGVRATFSFPGYNNVRIEARVTVELEEREQFEPCLVQEAFEAARPECGLQIQAALLDQVREFDWLYGEYTVEQAIRHLDGDEAAEAYLAEKQEERREAETDPEESDELEEAELLF